MKLGSSKFTSKIKETSYVGFSWIELLIFAKVSIAVGTRFSCNNDVQSDINWWLYFPFGCEFQALCLFLFLALWKNRIEGNMNDSASKKKIAISYDDDISAIGESSNGQITVYIQ